MKTSLVKVPAVSAGNGLPPEPPGFLSAYPGYRSTALLDRLRATDYPYLDAAGHVYLDYTGAGLPARAQLAAHASGSAAGASGTRTRKARRPPHRPN